ncbi:Fe(3+) ABC transporter substrate-binding protein [Oceanihabitans sediminis]|uniref:Iron ABC transporter substrate-binding protein n=1 Tax=Oceanihabitans sediminis TaxID=1812012 RepID=A0A368P1B4_9FLAO|nr:Fe(3+) ABC transporter substrate-binding protein [Oceanihabitans sediminis]MDX1279108.1 Fe(3+) ABC transporter substrate-binding protein [Oceanihabitans sediminis]MDX1774670.1 Fe(3+) ABC transporter substrate-binding protein [Oceanihabitans sediminis]RBP28450.1 iron(III) transport system substrate-binding protein [Oceanihabitans sediminis]RCU56647.1 iron ABC transporter substrate-binding protein [Oceanihabitans sediminis]
MKKLILAIATISLVISCGKSKKNENTATEETTKEQVVNVYTHRHYEPDQNIFKMFEDKTGIKVKVINASADELIQKMKMEGKQSPADVLITVDAGRLSRAKDEGLLQSIESEVLEKNIPAHLQDVDNQWFGLTKRARIIAYAKDRVKPEDLSSYEALVDEKWKGKILVRSSANIYNQSLMASIIANDGEEAAKTWAEGIVANMARSPKGSDRDQVKAVVAGEGDIAIVNSYYIGKMLNSPDAEEVKTAQQIGLFFPNQEDRGTHINVSGAGVAKYAPNKENAIQFIEFLIGKEAQQVFTEANYEYPVLESVEPVKDIQAWGDFKEDTLGLNKLGENNKKAVLIFDAAGWK